jgi:hypothetical protein
MEATSAHDVGDRDRHARRSRPGQRHLAGVANADEPSSGSDRTAQELGADGTASTQSAEGRGDHDRSGPHGNAHRDGMGDYALGHHGARPEVMRSGDHENCDEQPDGDEADA